MMLALEGLHKVCSSFRREVHLNQLLAAKHDSGMDKNNPRTCRLFNYLGQLFGSTTLWYPAVCKIPQTIIKSWLNIPRWHREGLQDVRWHDERDEYFEDVDLGKCWGLILNSQGQGQWFSGLTNSRHWHGIRRFQEDWWGAYTTLLVSCKAW